MTHGPVCFLAVHDRWGLTIAKEIHRCTCFCSRLRCAYVSLGHNLVHQVTGNGDKLSRLTARQAAWQRFPFVYFDRDQKLLRTPRGYTSDCTPAEWQVFRCASTKTRTVRYLEKCQ